MNHSTENDKKNHARSARALPEGWIETTLGEVCDVKGGKRLPKGTNLISKKTNHPYIRITDLHNNQIIETNMEFVPEKIFPAISKYIVNSDDVIMSVVGTIGIVAKISSLLNGANLTENCVKLINLRNIDSNYLYFYLISRDGKHEIEKNTVGAVQKKLPIYGIQNIQLILPPLLEQKAIADVLSSFDNKIELLREQNKTLEQTAQTVFNEWFGKYSVDEPENLPEGWRVVKITEIIDRKAISYKCTKSDLSETGSTPILDQGTDGLYGYTEREPDFIASPDKPVLVFTNHTCNYWFIDYPFSAIQNVIPYKGTNGYDEYFMYFLTKDSVTFTEYKGHWPEFEAKDFVIPPMERAQEFSKITKPFLQKIQENKKQIKLLSKTRDALLPRLMKGEMRVKKF